MSKKVTFSPKPASTLPPNADTWVTGAVDSEANKPPSQPTEKLKRFTFDVPESLHRRIKAQCAAKGVDMAEEMRHLLLEHFPEP
jgi:hypothetical protein